MMKKILLAEDHIHLQELISDYLTEHGYMVDAVGDGLSAWEKFQIYDYDLILLDIMMPEIDGFTLCEKIREREDVPILFITAKVEEEDQLRGYQIGADDYIIKPFSLAVLMAKCDVILKRQKMMKQCIEAGRIRLYPQSKEVYCKDEIISLQALDFKLLMFFMKNQGRVLTREQIIWKLWGYDYEGNNRAVDTHVKKLRKALGEYGKYIRTVIKEGYKFEVS